LVIFGGSATCIPVFIRVTQANSAWLYPSVVRPPLGRNGEFCVVVGPVTMYDGLLTIGVF